MSLCLCVLPSQQHNFALSIGTLSSAMLSQHVRCAAVHLVFSSGFVADDDVVTLIGSAINDLGIHGNYGLLRLMSILTLRHRYILLRMLAESVLDVFPDPGTDLPPPMNMQYDRTHESSHLAHVAHFMDPVMMRRCHVNCGCWWDTSRSRR